MDHDHTDQDTAGPGVEPELPGTPAAERRGCHCSVLLNRHTPEQRGQEPTGFVNPLCPLHGSADHRSELPSTS